MLRAPAALLYVIDFLVGRRRQGRHADRPALELAAGYEVNVNFAPVIWYEGWLDDYRQLFDHLDAVLSPAARAQLAA